MADVLGDASRKFLDFNYLVYPAEGPSRTSSAASSRRTAEGCHALAEQDDGHEKPQGRALLEDLPEYGQ